MNKNTKYFLILIALILLVVTGYRYKEYVIDKNFLLKVNTSCNPETEKCFIADESLVDENSDNPPYKKVEVMYRDAPLCLEEHDCTNFSCATGLNENECRVVYCSQDSLEDGEKCQN